MLYFSRRHFRKICYSFDNAFPTHQPLFFEPFALFGFTKYCLRQTISCLIALLVSFRNNLKVIRLYSEDYLFHLKTKIYDLY